MAAASSLKWFGNGFISKRIPNLPRSVSSDTGDFNDHSIDYAGTDDEQACRELVAEAGAGGDNVGLGEYLDDEEFLYLFSLSEIFKVLDARGRISTFLVIQPCMLARSWDCCLARIHVFRSSDLQPRPEFYRLLLHLGVEFTRALDAGYTRCVVCVANGLHKLVEATRHEGFLIVASLPDCVNLATLGLCEDLVMVNSLGFPKRPRRSSKDLSAMVNKFLTLLKTIPSYDGDWRKLKIPCLPQTYIFSSGLRVTVRMMEERDVAKCYAMLVKAAEKGQGYGLDDCPSLEIFYQTKLRGNYSIVITTEDTTTPAEGGSARAASVTSLYPTGSTLVSFSLISDAWHSRNPDARLCESSIVVSEEFRGQGLARQLIEIELSLMKELGYRGMLNDALLSNSRMQRALKGNAYPSDVVGVIPDGTLTANYGWDDQVMDLTDFRVAGEAVKTFTELAKLSLERDKKKQVNHNNKESKL